jgi:hypothetical protein
VADDQRRRDIEALDEADSRACVERAANRMVGELFSEGQVGACLHELVRWSDAEFVDQLVDRELALIADGVDPLGVALGVAVLRVAREALRASVAIHALPKTPMCHAVRNLNA